MKPIFVLAAATVFVLAGALFAPGPEHPEVIYHPVPVPTECAPRPATPYRLFETSSERAS